MREIIKAKLREIEEKENVRIILAVESGSRAWGFASPDSDYDVRFIYVRKETDYLRLNPLRDVIEWQLDETLDINGWDLKKTLQLLHNANPTVFEWCMSPIVYQEREEAAILREILPAYFSIKKSLFHYYRTAESTYKAYLQGERVRIKKYFYALRPLLAAKWIMDKKCPPPMLFSELVEAELEEELRPEVTRLVDMKVHMLEADHASKVEVLNAHIEKHLEEVKRMAESAEVHPAGWELLDEVFMRILEFHPQEDRFDESRSHFVE